MDAKGNLYGTTFYGGDLKCGSGQGCGVVFKVDPATSEETVLYRFNGTDGANPAAGLILDAKGNLYGTTYAGGNLSDCNENGCGVVFKLDPTTRNETILYRFTGADGANPVQV